MRARRHNTRCAMHTPTPAQQLIFMLLFLLLLTLAQHICVSCVSGVLCCRHIAASAFTPSCVRATKELYFYFATHTKSQSGGEGETNVNCTHTNMPSPPLRQSVRSFVLSRFSILFLRGRETHTDATGVLWVVRG